MAHAQPTPEEPQLRFVIACPHSGSELLEQILAESPDFAVTSDLTVDEFNGGHSNPNALEEARQRAFTDPETSGKRLVLSLQHLHPGLTLGVILETRPALLIRDPVRLFAAWKHVGQSEEQIFINNYLAMFSLKDHAPSDATFCVYEKLARQPRAEVQRLCDHWNTQIPEVLKLPVTPQKPSWPFPSNSDSNWVEEHLGRHYLRGWQDDVSRLRAILSQKTWIGFDLDDTLHEFRRASSTATGQVLADISQRHDILLQDLKQEYSRVLRAGSANAFSDGKTSFDYRRERFTAILEHFIQPLPEDSADFVEELLKSYETTLTASLETKCGALGLLWIIKNMGKKIAIVTEGPQDAQERTIKALGIGGYVDFLATTNRFRVSKTDGLFGKVLHHLDISPTDMAYIGDSEQRDMEPAMAEGIFCIHLAEAEHVALDVNPPRVNTLRKIQYIMSE
ncbi:Haloacid dehalogenase-like hydrolase [Plectosphaerella plurivora]|uniref:Haloacid dehalogenase-like hydrolase n=1 Tax=Plectosphaerella plurivora TaxID=936078 RepID=A0A9P8VN39_9PEZI|nr:Haloacid dehalogenase-like hydrolase [Plectosphaerella plurivora]